MRPKGGTIRFPWALRPPDLLLLNINSWQGVLLLEKIIPHFHQSCDRKDWEHDLPLSQDTRSKSDFLFLCFWVGSVEKSNCICLNLEKKRKTGILGTGSPPKKSFPPNVLKCTLWNWYVLGSKLPLFACGGYIHHKVSLSQVRWPSPIQGV